MKFLLYYLLPCYLSYKLLYEILGITMCFLSFTEPNHSHCKTIYITYNDYKKMTKCDKLYYFRLYINSNKILSFIDNNKINIITVIGVMSTFIFGFISIL